MVFEVEIDFCILTLDLITSFSGHRPYFPCIITLDVVYCVISFHLLKYFISLAQNDWYRHVDMERGHDLKFIQ